MRQIFASIASAALLSFGVAAPVAAQERVDFQRQIRPILAQNCFKCHGPAIQKRGLRLDLRVSALKRRAIVPGEPEASKLVQRILAEDEKRMPPAPAGQRLTTAQVQALKTWITQGAPYTPHWAFVKPAPVKPPPVRQAAWTRNPIDRFILARLDSGGLTPSPQADRATLIRRLFLDLIGLLPSPEEVDEFVRDGRSDAYDRLVDRLLSSPHYGERQARHWLDLARYADSNGYTIDGPRSIWPWRDWVIAAFNRNLPFDRFTIEQLAGDLVPSASREQLVATGFQRNTPFNEEGGTNPEQFRVERTVDRTNTLAAVWLGLTVACAQCHDHKFDPITQKDYYRLYAFFNSTDEPELTLPSPQQGQRLEELRAELSTVKRQDSTRPKSAGDLEKLLAQLEKESNGGWRNLYPKMISSQPGATFRVLEDRSVVVSGKAPDAYEIHAVAPDTGTVTAVRLEALTDSPAEHQAGPSGAITAAPELTFETDGVPHPFVRMVSNDLDGQAVFFLKKPHLVREGQAFVFHLRFGLPSGGAALRQFRLAVTFASSRFLQLPAAAQRIALMDGQKRSLRDMEDLRQALRTVPVASKQTLRLEKQIQVLEAQLPMTLILRPTAHSRPTFVQKRGDFLNPGESVEPGTPEVLPAVDNSENASPRATANPGPALPNRLDLARWLVSPNNSLTARVVVNRIWQQYFGKGIVETENDFGSQGALPTHPELLDWLALEFIRQGWDMKRMHRLIVTSATYRQSSAVRADLLARDPANRLLGRQQRLRLEAEIIRDAALSASGLLNRRIGGPGVYPPQPPEIFAFTQNKHPWPESQGPDRYRRGLYTFIWRQSQHPLQATFDAPDAQTACTRRNRSNTPLQALHLANDPTFFEFARALADSLPAPPVGDREVGEKPLLASLSLRDKSAGRVLLPSPPLRGRAAGGVGADRARLAYAFKRCLSRSPTPAEEDRLLTYLQQQRQIDADQAWTMVARVLLNLDEFITRE
jgi:mono/diheme cytochrome c family protein